MLTTTSGSHDPISRKIDRMSKSHGHIMCTEKYALTQYRVVRSTSCSGSDTRATHQQWGWKWLPWQRRLPGNWAT